MGFQHYWAVGASNLYDDQPKAFYKAVLLVIAHLIRDKEDDPLFGLCTAGQKYLRQFLGIGHSTVERAIARLVTDGLITVKPHHVGRIRYNHYSINMEKINEARRPREEVRSSEGTPSDGAVQNDETSSRLDGTSSRSSTNPCEEAEALRCELLENKQVDKSTIAIADVADSSLCSDKTEEQDQEQQPNSRDSVPNPAGDLLGPGPSDIEESAKAEDPGSAPPFSREGEPARWLANYLWVYVVIRPEVEIPYAWETLWSLDFQDALNHGWTLEELEAIVQASQYGAARQFYLRAKSICYHENLERLHKIAEALGKKGLLQDFVCPTCKAFFPDFDLMVDHHFASHTPEIDPADAAEEEAEYAAEEADGSDMYYPWEPDPEQLFNPFEQEGESPDVIERDGAVILCCDDPDTVAYLESFEDEKRPVEIWSYVGEGVESLADTHLRANYV